MPNWTENRIVVTGSAEVLNKMLADGKPNKNNEIHFGSWFPIPETFLNYDTTNHPYGDRLVVGEPSSWEKDAPIVTEELIEAYKKASAEQKEKYGVVGWYDWNVQNYGCKWDSEIVVKRVSEEHVEFITDTPWTAPMAFLNKMSRRYPELTFTMYSHYEDGYNEIYCLNNGVAVEVSTNPVMCPANDYILKEINKRQDSEERLLLTKCCQKYFIDGYWKVSIESPEEQYKMFISYLPHLTYCVAGKEMMFNEDNELVEIKN